LARPVGGLHAAVDCGRTSCAPAKNPLACRLHGRRVRPRWTRRFQAGEALTEAGQPGLARVLVDAARRRAVHQPGDAVTQLADRRFHRGQGRACGPRLRRSPAPRCLGPPLRMGPQRPDGLPDRHGPPLGPDLGRLPHPLAATAVGIRAQAAVRGVRARLALARPGAEALPIVGRAPGRIRIKLSIDNRCKVGCFTLFAQTLTKDLRRCASFSRRLGRQTFCGGTGTGKKAV